MDLSTWFTQTPTDRPVAWVSGQLVSEKTFFHDAECFRVAYEKAAVHRVVRNPKITFQKSYLCFLL